MEASAPPLPEALNRLAATVAHTFYTNEQAVVLDYVMRTDWHARRPTTAGGRRRFAGAYHGRGGRFGTATFCRITEERAREDLMLARATITQALTTLTEDQLIRR